MKTKEFLYKLLYAVSMVLGLVFCVMVIIDWVKYDALSDSAPFYVFIIARAITFLLPALISFIVGKVIHNKTSK